ncbi:MAG: rhomboid family intramembrane serine protease [Muribaculaceae bacterium]
MDIINEIKYRFKSGSLLAKIIYVNIGVFVAMKLAMLLLLLMGVDVLWVTRYVEMPSSLVVLARRPWTVLTYMFVHADVLHILCNMVCFYWMGRVFMEFNTAKQLMALYIYGGIGGALLYLLAYNVLPLFAMQQGSLVGASASVLCILVAAGMRAPEYRINLLFFGSVALKWVVAGMVLIDVISIDGTNPGGHIAHIGGAVVGLLYAIAMRRGVDITKPVNVAIDALVGAFSPRKRGKKMNVGGKKRRYHYAQNSQNSGDSHEAFRRQYVTEDEEAIDVILEKIKQSGYASLTKQEKERLFTAGKKKNK